MTGISPLAFKRCHAIPEGFDVTDDDVEAFLEGSSLECEIEVRYETFLNSLFFIYLLVCQFSIQSNMTSSGILYSSSEAFSRLTWFDRN